MTKAEYERLYRRSRLTLDRLTSKVIVKLRSAYRKATNQVAAVIRDAQLRGISELTINSQLAIQQELASSVQLINISLSQQTPNLITDMYNILFAIDREYILDALKDAGVTRLSIGKVDRFAQGINRKLIESLNNRVWQDGYTFSDRVILNGNKYQSAVKDLLSGGLAQGRDPIKIAKDITEYVKKGKGIIQGRWGKLKPGAKDFYKRIPKTVDYRAQRIVRSELYASLQDAGREEGRLNPATTDWYDWILEPNARPADDPCPDIAHNSPYRLQDLPDYPHPSCQCHIVPILRDRREFLNDLKRWDRGESVPHIDDWESMVTLENLV